ncbi:MAG: ABC transporter permease [Acidobacteria bacterium]|nr:ABC transporter permease [Acidobacteriota bacterium]
MGWWSKALNVFRPRLDREFDDELRCHLEMRAADRERAGSSPDDARAEAARLLGNASRIKEGMRDMDVAEWLDSTVKDVRYAVRQMRRSPGFTGIAVLSLALGIGANTGIFTLLDVVMVRSLPVRDPGALVMLSDPNSQGVAIGSSTGDRGLLSYHEFDELRGRIDAFEGMFASESAQSRYDGSINSGPRENIDAKLVTGEYFDVLGVAPAAGRFFNAGEDRGIGKAPYAVLSHAFWQRRFGGSPAAIGSTVRLGAALLTVVGVAGPDFSGETIGQRPDVWAPMTMQPLAKTGRDWLKEDLSKSPDKVMWLHVFGRLKPGATVAQAQSQADVLFRNIIENGYSRQLSAESRKEFLNQRLKLRPASKGASALRDSTGEALRVLLCVVGLVLLIACANIANLLMARASARSREMGVRVALGAGRRRLLRQLLTESLLIALLGGAAGLLVARAAIRLLMSTLSTPAGAVALDTPFDLRVLGFTALIAVATALLFGIAPALRATRTDVQSALKEGSRGSTGGGGRARFAKALVAFQVGLSMILLAGSGLFLKTLRNLNALDVGYSRDRVFQARVSPETGGYPEATFAARYDEIRDRLLRIPGVRGVTYSKNGLFNGTDSADRLIVEGFTPKREQDQNSRYDVVGADYFSTLGIPILRGREIGREDSARRVVVVNEAFAKTFFSGRDPLGRHITAQFGDDKWTFEVIGVSANVRDHRLRGDVPPRYYRTSQGSGYVPGAVSMQVVTAGPAAAVANAVRRTIQEFDDNLPVLNARPVGEFMDRMVSREKTVALLSAVFGAVALLLACIGLYGVLSFGVARRTSEIGIRMALGAAKGEVIRMVLADTGRMVALGLAGGVIAAAALTRTVSSMLFGVAPLDPGTLAAAAALLVAVAALAALAPAHRASRVDPVTALRAE